MTTKRTHLFFERDLTDREYGTGFFLLGAFVAFVVFDFLGNAVVKDCIAILAALALIWIVGIVRWF